MSDNETDEERKAAERAMALVQRHFGFRIERTSRARLLRALRDGAQATGHGAQGYAASLDHDPAALQSLVDRITVQETSFFRHPEQFSALAVHLLGRLPRPVTLWSAGCAFGQEAYSLAMLLEEAGIPGTVVATDISEGALARTAAGRYAERELGGLSPQRRARHLVKAGRGWAVNELLRRRVRVMRHNLLDAPPDEVRYCHVVFCRNVLIYLTPAHAAAVLDAMADHLPADLVLFVGGAETLWQVTSRFVATRVGGTYAHRPTPAVPASRVLDERTATAPQRREREQAIGAGPEPGTHTRRERATGWEHTTVWHHPAERERTTARDRMGNRELADAGGHAGRTPRAEGRQAQRSTQPPPGRARSDATTVPTPAADAAGAHRDAGPSHGELDPSILELARIGESAYAQGLLVEAIAAFRKWVYLDPDNPNAHLHLALALSASGDEASAARASRAAARALRQGDPAAVDGALAGYSAEEVVRHLGRIQEVSRR